jgi:hypothetical protein
MRSPREQEDFLERGRFGEGKQAPTSPVPPLVGLGLFFIAVGCACLAAIVLLQLGRDDDGTLFLQRAILSGLAGVVCCLWAWASSGLRKERPGTQ